MKTADDLLREARACLPHRPSPAEAVEAQSRGSLLIDIRGDDQRRTDGLIPGALELPRNSLEWRCDPASPWRHTSIQDWEQRLILICNEGFQSSLAAATLQQLGLRHATDVDGGFTAWKAAGMPVVAAHGPPSPDAAATDAPAAHWEEVYRRNDSAGLSWYQTEPGVSLEMLELLDVSPHDAVVDVGGGGSALVPALIARGFDDVSVLDCSRRALRDCRRRVGSPQTSGASRQHPHPHLLCHDILGWRPRRRYAVWHDRALLHFFVEPADRVRYVEVLRSAVHVTGSVVIGTFATDGPERCSGLPVVRYSAAQVAGLLGDGFHLVAERAEDHVTPQGAVQRFTWTAFRRQAAGR